MEDTPEKALADFGVRQRVKHAESKHRECMEERRRYDLQRCRDESEHERRLEEDRRLRDVWTRTNPAGKYVDEIRQRVERDAGVQKKILAHIRDTGEKTVEFLGTQFMVGQYTHFVAWYDVLTKEEYDALSHQVAHDNRLQKRREVTKGPFAGWTIELYNGWFAISVRMVDRRSSCIVC